MSKEYKLPKEFALKWLEALRSGKYKQDTGVLYDEDSDGFCCIGLAAHLEYPLHYLKTSAGNYGGVICKGGTKDFLKYELHKIPEELKGTASSNKLVGHLVGLNDDEGYSFEAIADWIEENVEFYEK